jgi:xylulokinase
MSKAQRSCAVGVDSGTQGTKVLVIGFERAEVLGRGSAPHAFRQGLGPGQSEQDPETWFWALETALKAALDEAKIDPTQVAALGVSAQQHGFVPLGANGLPIRPAKLWNDTSTAAECDRLTRRLGGRRAVIDKLGLSLAVGYTASKVLWLKDHEPESFRRLAHIALPHDYLNYRLTGKLRMEFGDASGTGLMDVRKREWNPEALAAVDPRLGEMLPPLRPSSEPLGYVAPEFAARFGWGRVLVSSGGGDNMMAAIGTGNVEPGLATLSLGTSGTISAYSPKPAVDPQGEIAAFCDSTGGWLALLCTMNVTNASELFKAMHGLSNEAFESLAAEAPAGADGLVFLPFIDGERVPVLPQASGVYFGLNRKTFDARHMARALIEGTTLNLGYGLGRMRELKLDLRGLRATGGGSKNGLWLQAAADTFGMPVDVLEEEESAALGAGLQAIWCWMREHGQDVPITRVVDGRVRLAGRTVQPRPENRETYAALQARFNSLWKSLEKEFRAHRKIQEKSAE